MNDSKNDGLTPVVNVWTQKDEALLKELQERKVRIMAEARKPLEELASDLGGGYGGDYVDHLIAHADAYTKALRPFTSGQSRDLTTDELVAGLQSRNQRR